MIDWTALLRLGLGQLRIHPEQFWALTPAELGLMAGISTNGQTPLGRGWLDALCADWPDTE